LPGSPVFEYLDGLIPRPDQTYLTLTEIIEAEEKEKINKEIANRRSRLGAVLGQVASDVQREVWGASPVRCKLSDIIGRADGFGHSWKTFTRIFLTGQMMRRSEEKLTVNYYSVGTIN
jgi:hypothetical protein